MAWPGWENFNPVGRVLQRKLSRGERMHAAPVIVDASMQIFDKHEAERQGISGTFFHSRKEARRWVELRLLAEAGQITDLRRQVRFPLSTTTLDGGNVVVGNYIADFVYVENRRTIVEDAKGQARREDLYLWKRRHMKAEHGIEIREV